MLRRAQTLTFIVFFAIPFISLSVSAGVIEQVIVAIDGEPYTLSNVNEFAKSRGVIFPKGELVAIENEDKEVLEQFITEKLVAAEVKRLGIRVGDDDIDNYIARIKERNKLSDSDLEETLQRERISMEKYRATIRTRIEEGEIVNSQVRKKVNITSEDVERYYKLNSKRYMVEEKIHLRHILLALPRDASPQLEAEVLEQALEIRKKTQSGEDFGQLARTYSQGAGAATGGDIGWVNSGTLLKEIEELARQLNPGTVSQPVRTALGIHLIKVEGKMPPQPSPLSEVAGRIKEELYAKALEERTQKWLKGDLRRRHRVDVKLPGVVFRAEEINDEIVSALMTSAKKNKPAETSFLSYLNPFSYIFNETPVDEDDPSAKKTIGLFGIPLFTTEGDADVPEVPGF